MFLVGDLEFVGHVHEDDIATNMREEHQIWIVGCEWCLEVYAWTC